MIKTELYRWVVMGGISFTGEASVMKNTIANTSKEMSAYSDFPPPEDFPNFMPHRKMLEYFRSYAKHFDLIKHIRFDTTVMNIERSATFETDGAWKITYRTK